jgi:predicted dehydrogenase
LEWLTDPILNGGGALTDFGCYGANIATWLLNGETPLRISCVTKQSKPDRYPKVDDDATIILDYAEKKVVVQASWNWSHNRKDMQIYGTKGYVNCKNANDMMLMTNERIGEKKHIARPISKAKQDPFRLLYEVVYNDYVIDKYSLYSIENNLIVSKILSLAKESARTQKTQNW